jgi:hypothetical protein
MIAHAVNASAVADALADHGEPQRFPHVPRGPRCHLTPLNPILDGTQMAAKAADLLLDAHAWRL